MKGTLKSLLCSVLLPLLVACANTTFHEETIPSTAAPVIETQPGINLDDVVVLDSEDGTYQCVISNNYTDKNEQYVIEDTSVTFPNKNLTVALDDVYTYKSIDPIDLLDYLKDMGFVDATNKELTFVAYTTTPYDPNTMSLPGFGVMYAYDNGDNWVIYSFEGILEKDDQYFNFHLLGPREGKLYNFELNQEFDNTHPTLYDVTYSKDDWSLEKFNQWCDNSFYTPYDFK